MKILYLVFASALFSGLDVFGAVVSETYGAKIFTDTDSQKKNSATVDELVKFIDVVKEQKNDWLNYDRQFRDAKYALLIKHSDQVMNQKKDRIDEFRNGDISRFFAQSLADMVTLHAQQGKEWKQLCDTYKQKGDELYQKHLTQSAPFSKYMKPKKTIGQAIKESIISES